MVIESGPFDFGSPADFRDTDLAQGLSFHQFAHLIRDPDLGPFGHNNLLYDKIQNMK